jgi:hypothetical protein
MTGIARDPAKALVNYTIPATRPWSGIIKKGQVFRIVDSYGQQAVDTLFYNAHDFGERYSVQDTMQAQGGPYIVKETVIMSNEGRAMLRVIADTCGQHDTMGGACSCEANVVRFGETTRYMHACRENFILEVSKYGMSKRDIVPNMNFFMNVPILPTGELAIMDGISQPGDYVEMIAEMDVLCVISNCPQINNPCNGFNPTPVQVLIWDVPAA